MAGPIKVRKRDINIVYDEEEHIEHSVMIVDCGVYVQDVWERPLFFSWDRRDKICEVVAEERAKGKSDGPG